jgi:hypothetical protein
VRIPASPVLGTAPGEAEKKDAALLGSVLWLQFFPVADG